MHRCLRPHALPARARCVPNFLTLNRPSFTKWRPISPWRSYTTAVEENRSNYTAQLPSSYAPKENEKNAELETSSGSQNKAQDDGDAFDFILEGYEKKLTNVVKEREEKKKRRVRGTFASYDMHIREKRQTPRRAGRPSPTEKAKRPPALHKSGQPLKYYKTRFHRSMRLEHALTKAPRAPALWARPRLVSVATMGQYSPYALNRVWNYNYARAQNEFDSRQSNRTATVLPPLLDPHAAEWVDLVLQRMESGNDLNLKRVPCGLMSHSGCFITIETA
jgi:hypothetical protein